MQVTITINMDNAAFDEEPCLELSRELYQLATNIETFGIESASQDPILDENGNRVGSMTLTGEDIGELPDTPERDSDDISVYEIARAALNPAFSTWRAIAYELDLSDEEIVRLRDVVEKKQSDKETK